MKLRNLASMLLLAATVVAVVAQDNLMPVTTKDGAVTFQMPSTWILGDVNDPTYKANYEKIKQNNPALAASMDNQANDENMQLYMLDGADSQDDGFWDNLNVKAQVIPGMSPKLYKDVADVMLKQMPFKGKGEYKIVDMPHGKTLTYWGTIKVVTPDKREIGMDMKGYIFSKGDKMYVLTFATGENQLKQKGEGWDKIVKSAKVK